MPAIKHLELFDEFLESQVNLNSTRISTLEQKVSVVESFLKGAGYDAKILKFAIQGSYAHKTIIKPPKTSNSFDADLVMYVRENKNWEPKHYINRLYRALKESPHYSKMVSRNSRCVTLDYAGDFHLDIVPITVRDYLFHSSSYRVCNRHENSFEVTDGPGFDNWWSEQNEILKKNQLIDVVRTLKYLRDIKTTFSCKSVLLTTLIGMQVNGDDEGGFSDTPTALRIVIGRLDDFLQENPKMPRIENPVLKDETFTRNWDQKKYKNFRSQINKYRIWVDDAFLEPDAYTSIIKWQKILGPGFAKSIDISNLEWMAEESVEAEDSRKGAKALLVAGAILGFIFAIK